MHLRVGDKVIIKTKEQIYASGYNPEDGYGVCKKISGWYFSPKMFEYCGKELTVSSIDSFSHENDQVLYYFKECDDIWSWCEECFQESIDIIIAQIDKELCSI